MIVAVVGSLILMKRRMMREVFGKEIRKLWNQWELRALVFASLTAQIVLIILGNRRRYISSTWIIFVVWCAYLLADSVATISLGILLNNLGDIYEQGGVIDPNIELTAFWAPFFLLHLGGPDTITAYSLEDNELYLRHAFGLAVQTLSTTLIIATAWNGSRPSFLAIPMIVAGCIKYGERTWTLWSASSDRFRESMLSPADAGPNYHKFMDEYCLKHKEGYHLKVEEKADADALEARQVKRYQSRLQFERVVDNITGVDNIELAHDLFHSHRFKRLFADLILSNQERGISRSLLRNIRYEDVFDVISIELGLMFDLLYTKAKVIHTRWGLATRVVTTSLTCSVLIVFCFADKKKYQKVDIYITLSLLIVAIILEIYAAFLLLFSDQSTNWFMKHKKTWAIMKRVKFPKQLPIKFLKAVVKIPRWSNSMGQFSFTRFCLEEEPGYKILRLLHLDKLREKHRYETLIQVPEESKRLILIYVKDKLKQIEKEEEKNRRSYTNASDLYTRGSCALGECIKILEWSVQVEFDQSILIWHIATEICYNCDTEQQHTGDETKNSDREMSNWLSQYMLYILVMYPFLLPVGIGLIRLRDTRCEARKFLEEKTNIFCITKNETHLPDRRKAALEKLLKVETHVLPIKVKGDRSKSVLFDACRVASAIKKNIPDSNQRWEMVRDVWLEMLTYAASQSRGSQHARQLRRGGELLTHVWLLMAHFGMTEQFQISRGHARAYLTAK